MLESVTWSEANKLFDLTRLLGLTSSIHPHGEKFLKNVSGISCKIMPSPPPSRIIFVFPHPLHPPPKNKYRIGYYLEKYLFNNLYHRHYGPSSRLSPYVGNFRVRLIKPLAAWKPACHLIKGKQACLGESWGHASSKKGNHEVMHALLRDPTESWGHAGPIFWIMSSCKLQAGESWGHASTLEGPDMKIMQSSPSSVQGAPLEQHRLINRKKNGHCNYHHKITIFIRNFDQLPCVNHYTKNNF